MKILITGATGFVGRNLAASLPEHELMLCHRSTSSRELQQFCEAADFVFHLAGINRPEREAEFREGNSDFTEQLLVSLRTADNACPVVLTSSTQAALENPYGVSKRAAEELVRRHAEATGASAYVYRLPGVFGKWSKPNYNTVVATFCYNVARGLPIQVNDAAAELSLVYIDDVVEEFKRALAGAPTLTGDGFCEVPVVHSTTLGWLATTVQQFATDRVQLTVPDVADPLTKSLHATYLSFLPTDGFAYDLSMHTDVRGSFTEIIRTADRGQFSVNISKPGITKGNHWHHTKNEKFLVVSGTGVIRFRPVGEAEVIEYHVSGERLQVVDIPTGYTHNIENLGDSEMVTFMWANEAFDPERPDTYFEEV
jgi:UDP-2-acetamido-2,6-beta-L-arabino-hexul-4-ose reductase